MGIFHEVNLEPYKLMDFTVVIRDWYHSQQIHKWLASFPVVDQTNLSLLSYGDAVLEIKGRVIITVSSLHARLDFAIGRLKKPTILPLDLKFGVTRQSLETV
jgi:hypothetical protein